MNVVHRLTVVAFVSDVAIPVFTHPESADLALRELQAKIGGVTKYPARGEGLPALHDHDAGLEQDVDVVGHDAPRVQVIALAVKMEEGVLDVAGDLGMAQRARPHAGVQPTLDPLPFNRISTVRGQGPEFVFEFAEFLAGQAVGQAVGNGLKKMPLVAVRKISARIP